MASGSELLALTSAVLQPLQTADPRDQDTVKEVELEMSYTNGGIFSPLPIPYGSGRPTCGDASFHTVSPTNTSGRKVLEEGRAHPFSSTGGESTLSSARVPNQARIKGVVNSIDSREIVTGTIATSLATSTPSPLTISARDIEAGSMDFTELATGMNVSSASSSQSCVQQQDWRNELLHQQKENLGTPQSTSSPAAPIKVRMSARKLREIRSPYLSGDGSFCESIPRALTPTDAGVISKEAATTCMSNTSQGHPTRAAKSLKQGILQKVHEDTPPLLDASDNSLVITTVGSKDRQSTSQKLLEQQTMKRDPSQTAESKIHIVPITASSQRANSRVSIGFEEDTVNAHSRRLPGGRAVTQFPGDNALPVPQAGVMSVGPISNLPLQTQGQTFPYATPRDYVDDGGAPYPVQATSRASNATSGASNATEVIPASGDVLATAKLVATCTAAATAAVLASSCKPHCIHEGSNTAVPRVKSRDGPPAADSTINTFPHTQEKDMPHNKYGINGDIHGKKPVAPEDENNAVAVHKCIPIQEPCSLNSTRETELDACDRDEVMQMYTLQNTSKSAKGKCNIAEEQLARDLAKSSKIAPGKHMPKHQLERRIQNHSPSSDRVYAADILKRLQRLEDLQHARTMDTVERTKETMDSKETTTKDVWMGENSKLLLSQPLKAHTSADDSHSTLLRPTGKTLVDQCVPYKAGTANEEPLQSTTIISEKRACDVTHSGNEQKRLAARMTVSSMFPVSKAASANSEGVGTDDEILAISKAGRVLLEVQAARDRLEMQCALQEAENQLVSMEQLSQALCAESANISSPLCELKVTEFISSLQQLQQRKKAEEKKDTRNEEKEKEVKHMNNEEGSEAGMEEGGHSRSLSSGGKGGSRGGKPLKACGHNSASRMMKKHKSTGKGTEKATSTTRAVARNRTMDTNRAMGTKQNESAGKPQCTTKVSSRKEEVSHSGSLGGGHLWTASARKQQETAYPPQYNLQGANDQFSTFNPAVHPPTSNRLRSGLTTPFPVLPNVQMHPPRATPADAPHHTASPMPTNCYPFPPTVSFRPHPFQPLSAAIPLGAPRTTPPPQDASCLREDLLKEDRVTTFGDTRTRMQHETVDACLQTSIDMHSHPPANLVVESLPGVHIEGDQQQSKSSFQAAGDLTGPHTQKEVQLASEERNPLHPHLYTAVEDIASATTENGASEEAMVVSVEGHRNPSPPSRAHSGPSFPPHPSSGQGGGEEGETISAGELDEKLRAQMESKALEWVQQELLVRVLAQADFTCDPSHPHTVNESTNSCSTCSPHPDPHEMALAPILGQTGMQLFVDSGVPVDSRLVERLVREAIQEQATVMLRELREGERVEEEGSGEERSSGRPYDTFSYTPPESGSTPSSTPSTPLLSTPKPTPPLSPEHTPRAEESVTTQLSLAVGRVATPTPTPPPLVETEHSAELLEDVDTPQATEDETEISGVTDVYLHHGVDTTGSFDHTHKEVPTPSATPPPQPISPGTPPQSTQLTEQTPHPVTPAMHTKELSLSESSSSSSVRHTHTLTPTPSTTTTDREISVGEYILHRPPLLLANTSLSEGEVPLSPGDARWYALYSTKLGKGGPQVGKRKAGRSNPTVQAFIDLKNSPDPSTTSDSSELSDSLQSERKQELSRGEIKRPPKHTVVDPFEKFLSKLNSSTPEESSSGAAPTTFSVLEDNTLSEMPSINNDDLSHGEVGRYETTPLVKEERRRQKGAVPKFQPGRFSPGEVQRAPKPNGRDNDVTFSHSKGEVPLRVRTRTGSDRRGNKSGRLRGMDLPVVHSFPSPGEVRLANKTRNGVDVINISRESSRLFSSRSAEAVSPTRAKNAVVGDFELPSSSSAKLKIFESEPRSKSQVIQVQSQLQVTATATEIAESSDKGKLQPPDSEDSPLGVSLSLNSESHSSPLVSAELPPPTHPPLLVPTTPITVTIPTGIPAEQSLSDSTGKGDSYTSDFDFSSISIPGFD